MKPIVLAFLLIVLAFLLVGVNAAGANPMPRPRAWQLFWKMHPSNQASTPVKPSPRARANLLVTRVENDFKREVARNHGLTRFLDLPQSRESSGAYKNTLTMLRKTQLATMLRRHTFHTSIDAAVAAIEAKLIERTPGALHGGVKAVLEEYLKYSGRVRMADDIAQMDYRSYLTILERLSQSRHLRKVRAAERKDVGNLVREFAEVLHREHEAGRKVEHFSRGITFPYETTLVEHLAEMGRRFLGTSPARVGASDPNSEPG